MLCFVYFPIQKQEIQPQGPGNSCPGHTLQLDAPVRTAGSAPSDVTNGEVRGTEATVSKAPQEF